MKTDRVVIGTILSLAIAATVFAGWYRWSQGHLAQDFWGAEVAHQIRFAEKVELVWLDAPAQVTGRIPPAARNQRLGASQNVEMVMIDGTPWHALKRIEITKAPGLIHARQSLIQDATYLWEENRVWGPTSTWTHALIIGNGEDETGQNMSEPTTIDQDSLAGERKLQPVTILFDLMAADQGFVRDASAQEKIPLTIPQGFRTFFREQGEPDGAFGGF